MVGEFGVSHTEAANWADILWLAFLEDCHEACNATFGDGFIDDASLVEAGLWTGIRAVFDHNTSSCDADFVCADFTAGELGVIDFVCGGSDFVTRVILFRDFWPH